MYHRRDLGLGRLWHIACQHVAACVKTYVWSEISCLSWLLSQARKPFCQSCPLVPSVCQVIHSLKLWVTVTRPTLWQRVYCCTIYAGVQLAQKLLWTWLTNLISPPPIKQKTTVDLVITGKYWIGSCHQLNNPGMGTACFHWFPALEAVVVEDEQLVKQNLFHLMSIGLRHQWTWAMSSLFAI